MRKTYQLNELISFIRTANRKELNIICNLVREEAKLYNEFDSTLLFFAIHIRRVRLEETQS